MKHLLVTLLILITSCGPSVNNSVKTDNTKTATENRTNETISYNNYTLTDKKVKFLWCDGKYNEEYKDTFNSIFIDEEFCKTISEPERAALGYVATFIGNECWWDGEGKEDRSNLKCKILTALNLGYQCSDKHLGYLRKWFKNDKKSLEDIENCPTIPYTATIQETFDEIIITVNGNMIAVFYKVNGINMRESESWSWHETDYFQLEKNNIRLIKKMRSKINHEDFSAGEE